MYQISQDKSVFIWKDLRELEGDVFVLGCGHALRPHPKVSHRYLQ
jgi:hypothetical protein